MVLWWRKQSKAYSNRRWVVVDVETTGMDASVDELVSIGAVALVEGRVIAADSTEVIIRRRIASSRENIVVHGIGVQAQLGGTEPRDALRTFIDFVGLAPMVAFHASFDKTFLSRAIKFYINVPFDNPWLDLAELAPVLDIQTRAKSLDEWLQRYGIPVITRHSAAADAFATALLAARLLSEARRQGASDFASLQAMARSARWVR